MDSNTITSHVGVQLGRIAPKPELGMIERAVGVTSGLQHLHSKLSSFRDKIEGNCSACGNNEVPSPNGLPGQLSESESVLRACHSLLDDIAGKF